MFQFLRIASRSIVVAVVTALLACVTQSAMAAATAARGDIVVVTVHGTVDATMAGMTVPLSAGAILQLPATVRTGSDGAVELRQGNSTFAAAGNTELEIPQSAAEDGLIERIVQIRGNAFYSIGKRTGTRLRVEAPYLVAVIKGTQFNVATQADSTTIALFEGHLEVHASDESDVVDLDAGEIAIRRRNDVSINVLRLNAAARDARRNQEVAARPQADSPGVTSDSVAARNDNTVSQPRIDTLLHTDGATRGDDLSVMPPIEPERIVDALPGAVDALPDGTELAAKPALSVDLPTVGVDLGAGATTAAADVGVDVGSVGADIGAGANVDIPAGAASVDVGASARAGDVASVDTSVATAVDASAGTVDVGVGTTVAAGATPVADVGATAAVDASAGTIDVGADTSVAGTDVGANVGVNAGAGNVGADVTVGGANVGVNVGSGGLEVDLGLGGLLGRKNRN